MRFFALASLLLTPAFAAAAGGDVIASFFIPGISSHGPRGLAWDGADTYAVADNRGLYQVRIIKFSYAEGAATIVSSFNCPAAVYWATDVAWAPGYIYIANDFASPIDRAKITVVAEASGSVTASFAGPFGPGVQLNGLTWDGTYLYAASYESSQVYRLNSTGSVVSSFTADHAGNHGLAFDGTHIYAVSGRPYYDGRRYTGAGAFAGKFTFAAGDEYVGGACRGRGGSLFISTYTGDKLVFEVSTGEAVGGVGVRPASLGRIKALYF